MKLTSVTSEKGIKENKAWRGGCLRQQRIVLVPFQLQTNFEHLKFQ
jgi:hypothetical protein